MRSTFLAAVGIASLASFLSGCAGGTDPATTAAEQQAASAHIIADRSQKGALILVRMLDGNLMGDQNCPGHVRLRKLGNGAPDKNTDHVDLYSADRWLLPKDSKPKDLNGSFLFPVANANSYYRSFMPIAPGRYVITYVRCEYGAPQYGVTKLEAGGDDDGNLFSYISPFGGASAITVGEGQIVDAGYIRFGGRRSDPIVLASEASSAERAVMKDVIPSVYPAITFKKFGE